MALVKCKECGKELSDKAKICPHCGYRKQKTITKKTILTFSVLAFIVVLLNFSGGKVAEKVQEKKEYKEYDELYSKTKQMMYEDAQEYKKHCKATIEAKANDAVNGTMNYAISNQDKYKVLWDNFEVIENNMKKLEEIPNNSYQESYNNLKKAFDEFNNLETLTIVVDNDYEEKCNIYSVNFENAYNNIK